MLSVTRQTVANLTRWLNEVVARGDWQAEASFISDTLTIHDDTGTRRFTREQWMESVLSTRSPNWRLAPHDVVVYRDRVGTVFTSTAADPQTGVATVKRAISVTRLVDGRFVEIWRARRSPEYGPWPNLAQSCEEWSVAEDPLTPQESVVSAAMTRYLEIRQTREAEGLRELFIDPMLVHGPGATREERLEEFISRVATELETTPGQVMEAPDWFVAGRKSILRWGYSHPHPTPDKPSPIAGLTLYAFRSGKVVERWQAGLPPGTGWSSRMPPANADYRRPSG
jgi:SnoaL-like domain